MSHSTFKNSTTNEEMEEMLLQQLENLFDRPSLKVVQEIPQQQDQVAGRLTTVDKTQQQIQPQYKLVFEKDFTNTFLITNPQAIFKVMNKKQFLALGEYSQTLLVDRLDEILLKCSHNSHILTDHVLTSNTIRQNQHLIQKLKPKREEDSEAMSMEFVEKIKNPQEIDLLMLCLQITLKLGNKNLKTVKKMIELLKKLTLGKRFLKCHIEFIYQHLKVECNKLAKEGNNQSALEKVDTVIKILSGLFEPKFDFGPQNYFYFSGFLSGIQVSTKGIQNWPFYKGFSVAIWFQIQEYTFQDNKNLPVLFNCFSQGFGGFECYFNGKKLFYRILQKNYQLPTNESNGVQIGDEFIPKKWYFLALEHDKPYLARAQLTAVINDKVKVANLPMDYPKIEKGAKLSMITVCKNFVGQMSSFILFREQVNNPKKFIQMYSMNEYGIFSNLQIKNINQDVFDSKFNQKILLFLCPERTCNKVIYDCIESNDGELMINSGVCIAGPRIKLFFTGGLSSLLPLLEYIQNLSTNLTNKIEINIENLLNDYLKLVNSIISAKAYTITEADNSNFFKILFFLISKMKKSSVNSATIQLLAEIRFQIGDSSLQEQFFQSLLFSSDFWINTQNVEVINEFWSFVKAIYSQNPVYYNKIFSIQNLIDLMIRISDIKDGHCCEYHKLTSIMFYQGQSNNLTETNQGTKSRSNSVNITNIKRQSYMLTDTHAKSFIKSPNIISEKNNENIGLKIYQIDKYLIPIAGVLEGVLTSGGNEILDQIQYVAKSLTIKSSPCFHLQMLKLLKVLLLDSKEDRHCASPYEFALHFINANGLQILLYLCSNSSFDVKSMCIKLIDVLSSHTSLIKMRIDTDLITYMCSIILPKQIIDNSFQNKNQIMSHSAHKRIISNDVETGSAYNTNQYQIVEEEEDDFNKKVQEDQYQEYDSNPKNNFINQFYQIDPRKGIQTEISSIMEQNSVLSSIDLQSQQYKVIITQYKDEEDQQQKKTQKFGSGLFMEDEEDEESAQINTKGDQGNNIEFDTKKKSFSQQQDKKQLNQTSKTNMFQKGLSLAIQEPETEEKSDPEDQESFADNKKFMQTQKIPSSKNKGFGSLKMKGLELNIPEDKDQKRGGQSYKKQIMFAEIQEVSKDDMTYDNDDFAQDLDQNKKQSKFANENVMSKSNLRQPKSFNFGFPEDDDSEEEEKFAQTQKQLDNFQTLEDDDLILPIKKGSDKNKILLLQKTGFQSQHMRIKSQNKPQTIIEDLEESSDQVFILGKKQTSNKEQLQGGTTGATKETNLDNSFGDKKFKKPKKATISFQKNAKLFTNANSQLNIDTEAINELFTYGGEKGEIIQSTDQEDGALQFEIEELASMCLTAMKRKNRDQPIIYESNQKNKSTFEQKYLADSSQSLTSQDQKKSQRQQFMTPQSVRGIKKIEFSMSTKEKEKLTQNIPNKTGTFSYQTIIEEASPLATSKSSSSRKDFIFGGTNDDFKLTQEQNFNLTGDDMLKKSSTNQSMQNQLNKINQQLISGVSDHKQDSNFLMPTQNLEDLFLNQTLNQNSDEYTSELENLYTSCLEWILSRAPSSLYQNIVVDDVDKISFTPALSLLMTLVTYSNNLLRQKALQDLYMLARWDPHNGSQILFHPLFHSWLLELLMPYQDFANSFEKNQLSGPALAVYDIGLKLHTLLIKNACMNKDEEAYKKINYVARWPEIVTTQNNAKNKNSYQREIETAHRLSRVLLSNLFQSLKSDSYRQRPQINEQYPTWKNIVHSAYLIEELILTSGPLKGLKVHQQQFEKNRDLNASLMKWIQKDYLFYYNGSNDRSLWAEWDVLEYLFQTIDTVYSEQFFNKGKNKGQQQQTIEENVFTLLEKSSADDFTLDIELLMYEGKGSSLFSTQNVSQFVTKEGKAKSGKGKVNILSLAAQALNLQHNTSQQNAQNQSPSSSQQSHEQTFMKTVLNLFCITLTQVDTKQLVQLWLERFERFIKFLMIVSETWKSRHIHTYNSVQKVFQEAITFALAFLFHEIHSTSKNMPQQQLITASQQQISNMAQSPKEQQFGKIFAQSLKNLMIYFINVIEYSKIRFTPSELENQLHLPACRRIFSNILVKSYSQGQIENLISFKDISRYKASDYDDFPESFYMEDWKDAFFNNEQIKGIIKNQIDYKAIDVHFEKRKAYCLHSLELFGRTEKTKEDILKRMQNDTLDVISKLSEDEFARKNKVALINDNISREQKHFWKKVRKQLFSQRGIWQDLGTKYLKQKFYKTNEGVKAFMVDRSYNGFQYIQGNKELNKKIFMQIDEDTYQQQQDKAVAEIQKEGKSIQEEKKKKKQIINEEDDEEEEEDDEDEDEDEVNQKLYEPQEQIINFFQKELTTREKIALKKNYITHIKEYIFQTKPKGKEIIPEMKCQILKPFYQRSGSICLTSNEIIFFDDIYTPTNQQEIENIFFFKYQKEDSQLLYKFIPLQQLMEVQRRRFLGKKTALEIFMMDNTSLLFNFTTAEDRDQFAKKVLRKRNQKCSNLKYYETLEPKRILKKRELTEKWMHWKISNFEYLMLLNSLAGRSFNDLSQYPVLPWIITDFQSQNPPDISSNQVQVGAAPAGYRDLNKNMQLLGSAERQAYFKSKYDDSDSFISMNDRFHCGSHYSNPGIVLHYLCRLSPYLDAFVELHGKSLDKPDRTFYTIQDSLQSALNDHSDIRELIPEFYFCPEMFENRNLINFGTRQDEQQVSNVGLPKWCHDSPYLFIIYMREAMESGYVSMNLGGWIDYIFGYKQRDQDAERSLNTFSVLSYEDGIDLDSITDELIKASYQNQIYNFGQTPSQLFPKNQKHPQRIPRNQAIKFNFVIDAVAKIKVYKPVVQSQQKASQSQQPKQLIVNEAIIKAKFFDDQTIVGVSQDNQVTYFIWLSRAHDLNPQTPFTCCEDKKKKIDAKNKNCGLDLTDRSLKRFDQPIVILSGANGQKALIRGGFWDGKIIFSNIDGTNSNESQSLNVHQSTVTCLAVTVSEKILISGSKLGDIIVWSNNSGMIPSNYSSNQDNQQWQVIKHLCDHQGQINCISINEEMMMFVSGSYDGTANLYNLWDVQLVRTFKHPNLAPLYSVIISQTPLPTCCMYSREDHLWNSFSINGTFLEKQKEECSHIVSPQVVKDSYFMDKLVYGTEKGYIIIRQLPLLKIVKKLQVSNNYPVLSLIISPEKKFMLVGCGDGGMNVVTEPNQSQNNSQVKTTSTNSSSTQQTVNF